MIHMYYSVLQRRIENKGTCPSWREVGEGAAKTGVSVALKAVCHQ